jgi:hypothetical protein
MDRHEQTPRVMINGGGAPFTFPQVATSVSHFSRYLIFTINSYSVNKLKWLFILDTKPYHPYMTV